MKTPGMILSALFGMAALVSVCEAANNESATLTVKYMVPQLLTLKDVTDHKISLSLGGTSPKHSDEVMLEVESNEANVKIMVLDPHKDGHLTNGSHAMRYHVSCAGGEQKVYPQKGAKEVLKTLPMGKNRYKVTISFEEQDAKTAGAGTYEGQMTFQIVSST